MGPVVVQLVRKLVAIGASLGDISAHYFFAELTAARAPVSDSPSHPADYLTLARRIDEAEATGRAVVLTGADLHDGDMGGWMLSEAVLDGSDFSGANLSRATLVGSSMRGVRAMNADFTYARLDDASLRNADLTGADLSFASLTRADLRGAGLDDVRLDGADLTGALMDSQQQNVKLAPPTASERRGYKRALRNGVVGRTIRKTTPEMRLRLRPVGEGADPTLSIGAGDIRSGRFLLLGPPGSGKTVLVYQIMSALLDAYDENDENPVPLVFNCAAWTSVSTVEQWIVHQASSQMGVAASQIGSLLSAGDIFLLMDGLDELIERDRRVEFVPQLSRLLDTTECHAVISSRPAGVATLSLPVDQILELQPAQDSDVATWLDASGLASDVIAALYEQSDLWSSLRNPLFANLLVQRLRSEADPLPLVATISSEVPTVSVDRTIGAAIEAATSATTQFDRHEMRRALQALARLAIDDGRHVFGERNADVRAALREVGVRGSSVIELFRLGVHAGILVGIGLDDEGGELFQFAHRLVVEALALDAD